MTRVTSTSRAGFSLSITARTGGGHAGFIDHHLRLAAPHVRRCPPEVSLALVGDRVMARLHARFLDNPRTTDVLTFELAHDTRGRCVAGEIVICVPQAVRLTRRTGVPIRHELLLYALHGLLHLAGHDDRDPASYAAMHREEDRILARIRIGPLFRHWMRLR